MKNNLLKYLLQPMLRPVALMPESFTFPKPVAMGAPAILSQPTESNASKLSLAQEKFAGNGAGQGRDLGRRNSLSRRSSRFISGILRTVLGGTDAQSHPPSIPETVSGGEEAPPLLEVGGNVSSLYKMDLDEKLTEEVKLLTPLELKRMQVRKNLLDITENFSMRLDEVTPVVPVAIRTVISTIRDLIIVTQPIEAEHTNDEDKEFLYRNRRRFEYGTFFTSCSALLFLRLICRAMISPDEYGVLVSSSGRGGGNTNNNSSLNSINNSHSNSHSNSLVDVTGVGLSMEPSNTGDLQQQQQPSQQMTSSIMEQNNLIFDRSTAVMVILSHVFSTRDMLRKSEAKSDVKSNEDSVSTAIPSFKVKSRRNLDDNLMSFGVLALSEDLSTKLPLIAASKCVEMMKNNIIPKQQQSVVRQTLLSEASLDGDEANYSFDFTKPQTRWALAEVAKSTQHIANISCLPKEEMMVS